MAPPPHGQGSGAGGQFRTSRTHPPEVHTHMYPTILIIIFLLFFAVLAFGWFYWQRAKARAADETTDVASETVDAAPAPVETDAPAASDMATASNDQQ